VQHRHELLRRHRKIFWREKLAESFCPAAIELGVELGDPRADVLVSERVDLKGQRTQCLRSSSGDTSGR